MLVPNGAGSGCVSGFSRSYHACQAEGDAATYYVPVHCCQYGRREVTQAAAAARQREKPLREGRDRDILVGALVGMGANAKVRAGRLKDDGSYIHQKANM